MINAFLLLSAIVPGQNQADAVLEYKAPKSWGKEVIPLPPGFAPAMKWKGKEALRFAPGMMSAKDKSFFTYTILLRIDRPLAKLDRQEIHTEMLAYYQGLGKAVWGNRKPKLDTNGFKLVLKRTDGKRTDGKKTRNKTSENSKSDKAGAPAARPPAAYQGRLDWIEPFVTHQAQRLYLSFDLRSAGPRSTVIFVCASPRPRTDPVWKVLFRIRDDALRTIGKAVKRVP